jgi:hypothetical protein
MLTVKTPTQKMPHECYSTHTAVQTKQLFGGDAMRIITLEEFQKDFDAFMDFVIIDDGVICIESEYGCHVLLSLERYDRMKRCYEAAKLLPEGTD